MEKDYKGSGLLDEHSLTRYPSPGSFGIYDLTPVSTPKYSAQRTYTENIPE
jgi:hypothetical protein